jgi:glycine/serine hydroxymethyltransferase
MKKIAKWIADIVRDFEGNKDRVSKEVMELCEKFKTKVKFLRWNS